MKSSLLAWVILFSILNVSFRQWAVIAWFEMNRDRIAAEMCTKRFSSDEMCAGSCVLQEKLSESEESSPASETRATGTVLPMTWLGHSEPQMPGFRAWALNATPLDSSITWSSRLYATDIQHPPENLV